MKILKGIISSVVFCSMILSMRSPVFAARIGGLGENDVKIGDIIGSAVYTDIVAKINNYDIASFNVNGDTVVVVEDLRNYGFDVQWDSINRSLNITRANTSKVASTYVAPKVSKTNIGKKAYDVLYSDIKTYVDGYLMSSYNIGGKTVINIHSLAIMGYINWYESSRVITLTISGLDVKNNNIYQNKPFEHYRKYIGMTTTELKRLFPEFQYDMSWLGSAWYYRENDYFYYVSFADGRCNSVGISLEAAYPAIVNYVNSKGNMSKKEFESFIGRETTFVDFPDEFSSPFLKETIPNFV